MFRPPVLDQFEKDKLAYYLNISQTLKECHRIRIEEKTYHRYAIKIDAYWRNQSKRAPTLSYMWKMLTEAICKCDSELCASVRKLCNAEVLKGSSDMIIEELAYLLAGQALEDGKPR